MFMFAAGYSCKHSISQLGQLELEEECRISNLDTVNTLHYCFTHSLYAIEAILDDYKCHILLHINTVKLIAHDFYAEMNKT